MGGRMNGARMYGWIVVGRWMDRWGKERELVVGSRPPRMRRWTGGWEIMRRGRCKGRWRVSDSGF